MYVASSRILSLALFPLIALLAFKLPFTCAFAFSGKVVKVTDGDTIVVLTPDYQQIKVRLYGIDCPERKQAFGAVATRFVRERIAGKTVEVTEYGKDRYGRIIGVVDDLNESLLAAGLAWVYPQYCKKPFCKDWYQLQKEASQSGFGLWRDPEPVPPWKWRKSRRPTY